MAVSRLGPKGALALAALALLIAEPAATVSGAEAVPLAGQLVVMHADDFDRGLESDSYALQLADGSIVPTDVTGMPDADAMVGDYVELARGSNGSEFVATRTVAGETSNTETTTSGAQQTAVILFNFTNDNSEPWTTNSVTSTVFGASSSVAAYYREVSNGLAALEGTVVGWLTVPYDNSGCRYSTWSSAASAASHLDLSSYRHVVFAFPHTTCTWAGLSTVGGKYSWINGAMTIRTVGHELAHEMGVHHASALNCTSNGVRVSYSSTCTAYEYGDPFSIMGTGTRHLTNLQLAQVGWLSAPVTVTSSGYYSLAPAEYVSQPRLLRIPRGDGTFLYLELRQDYGSYDVFPLNAPATRGVSIRIAPDFQYRVQSRLLDMTPSTIQFEDAALTVGHSFTDPVSRVTITTTAASSTGATVAISWPGASIVAPSPTPSSTPSPTPTASPTPRPTATPTPSATAPPSPTPTPSASASTTPSATPQPTATTGATLGQALTAPASLTATRTWGRRVVVKWTAASGPVAGYRVVRNGNILGRVSTLRFVDRVPRHVRWANYAVRAFDRYGHLGPRITYTLSMK